jgi:hypothetical protein
LKQTADQIIQLIVDQTNLPKVEVLDMIHQLQRSFNCPVDELKHENDPTFPKLLAQELNVDLGDPTNYLYSELIYDKDPLFVRVIPLTTVNKAKIKTTLRSMVLELEKEIRILLNGLERETGYKQYSADQIIQLIIDQSALPRDKILTGINNLRRDPKLSPDELKHDNPTVPKLLAQELNIRLPPGLSEELMLLTRARIFVRNGILFYFRSYSDMIKYDPVFFDDGKEKYFEDFKCASLINSTLEAIIDQTELFRTFSDYQIIRTSDPTKTFIPHSLVDKFPPDWSVSWSGLSPNYYGFVQFPYITLESLITTPELKSLSFYNPWVKEIVGTEALQYCSNLKKIHIFDQIETLTDLYFPPTLSLPNLELLDIGGTILQLDEFDLSFLQHSPKLQHILLHMARSYPSSRLHVKKLILPPFPDHPFLEEIEIGIHFLGSIVLNSPWNCPNLRKITITTFQIETLNLIGLKHCSGLRVLNLCANNLKLLDLSPLKHCSALRELDLRSNCLKSLDLSPLHHCPDLRKLLLGHNLFDVLDLSPLENHPSLESINLEGNLFSRIDLSPLLSCSHLSSLNLKDNPIDYVPKSFLDHHDPAVLLAYDSPLRFPPR